MLSRGSENSENGTKDCDEDQDHDRRRQCQRQRQALVDTLVDVVIGDGAGRIADR